ncbi:MAG: phosphoenolpyruvate--protein phosphotransferase, partial [Planctomycetota bacterium]
TGARRDALAALDQPTIVLARELTPSQAAAFDRERVLGMVTDLGGRTGHTAIVAKALGLPAVVGCLNATREAVDGAEILVDGDRGAVVIDPDEQTIGEYAPRIERSDRDRLALREFGGLEAVTADGTPVELLGNIEFPEEAKAVVEAGGAGVGLYRTEFLYLTSATDPSEEDHFAAYQRCIQLLEGRPITIRTVDLGADKHTQERSETPERNPFLGLRSIRYCLKNVSMFQTQLRAILRASALGKVKVMFPLVTSLREYHQAKHLLFDAMEDLAEHGIEFDRDIEIGMMVEVPSAAIMAPTFAREAGFFSIGTNDLVQYTLAVDRTNERVASLYQPAHPAVVKLIRDVAQAARNEHIGLSCCGEAAADPAFAALLIGLGVRTLSLTPPAIAPIKRVVRSVTVADCEDMARTALELDSEAEAEAYLRDRIRKMVPEDVRDRFVDD